MFLAPSNDIDHVMMARFKQTAYRFNFMTDVVPGNVVSSRETYKYFSYCNLLKSKYFLSKSNAYKSNAFFEEDSLNYFFFNSMNFLSFRYRLVYTMRDNMFFIARFFFFLKTFKNFSFFIRKYKNVNMGNLAQLFRLTYFSIIFSLGFCYDFLSFRKFLLNGLFCVDGEPVCFDTNGIFSHNSLISFILNENYFYFLFNYKKHLKRVFFSTQSYWSNSEKLFRPKNKNRNKFFVKSLLSKNVKLSLPTERKNIIKKFKNYYPRLYNTLKKNSKIYHNTQITNKLVAEMDKNHPFFKHTLKNWYGEEAEKKARIEKIIKKRQYLQLLAERGRSSNRNFLTHLVPCDFSSFRKNIEFMPLTLQCLYVDIKREPEYNLNGYSLFNYTNFRTYNWLIIT